MSTRATATTTAVCPCQRYIRVRLIPYTPRREPVYLRCDYDPVREQIRRINVQNDGRCTCRQTDTRGASNVY